MRKLRASNGLETEGTEQSSEEVVHNSACKIQARARGIMARRAYRSSACIASRARRAEIISQVLGSDTWLPFMLSLIHSNDQPAMEVLFSGSTAFMYVQRLNR